MVKTRNHHLEDTQNGYRCTVCLWDWKSKPESECPGLPRRHAEPHFLLTFTQLKAKGLKPVDRDKPDGCYYRHASREWLYLYDERQALPRRKETARQKEARERSWLATQEKYRCPQCGKVPKSLAAIKEYRPGGQLCVRCAEWAAYWAEQDALAEQTAADERTACEWAAAMLECDDWVLLDFETTSLTGYIVEIAVLDRQGTTLFHSLVNPQASVSAQARVVHQITDEELAQAPTLPQVWERFMAALRGRTTIVTFNVEFDRAVLFRSASRYGLDMPTLEWQCLMRKYAQYVGDWSEYWGDYRWQRLPGGDHRALLDAMAALWVMRHMAAHRARLMAQNSEQEVPQ